MATSEFWKSKETDDWDEEFTKQTLIYLNSDFMNRFVISLRLEKFAPYLIKVICESIRGMHVCMHACMKISIHHLSVFISLSIYTHM